MPTVQQLEQRLNRLTKKLAAASPGGGDATEALRLTHKRQRRLQRKLRRARPSPPAGQKTQAPAPPPAESQGEPKS
jgi:hypothetical protein